MLSGRGRGLAALLATAAIAMLAAAGLRRAGPTPAADPPARPSSASRTTWAVPVAVLVLLLGTVAVLYGIREQRAADRWAMGLTGGDPHRAPALMIRNGCAGCHTIPGVPGARGTVGPKLSGLTDRAYIGGVLPNTPDNLVAWIRDSRAANPRTAMPSTRIPEDQARDIAAYLYALPDRP